MEQRTNNTCGVDTEELLGSVTYNGCKADQVDLCSLAAYVEQSDNHFPTLTVKETFEFAHKCLVDTVDPNDPLAVNEQHTVDILISLLGLTECADTMIGDKIVRGVSGGQKRRVALGEMMTSRAPLLLLDEFSNGLDTSTTFNIAKAVQTMAEVLEKTIVMTMLQPPPEVYNLFDNIIVLDDGQVIYNGPRTELPSYFESIGSHDTVDTSSANASTLDFAAQFQRSAVCMALLDSLHEPEAFISNSMQPRRAWMASMRDVGFNGARMVQALVMGTIIGTVFLDIGRNDNPLAEAKHVPINLTLFFLALIFQSLATLAALDVAMERRAVLFK
ncbi:Aste57867_3194 [Aphanomyces stellatus]|uniref:Aste57867_3194 protein n=1 Tax=Aphanomyces stellatus TaxID=120398 RepID=A0A485KA84_9STRA|nr:hypothetical protein As57867_003185 [Aphanomyces stellatus]VFT80368.1 Aste57867_3194 [Aphanomyces stellatus]